MSSEIVGKLLNYVETDLDRYRVTIFENEKVGASPVNWVETWNPTRLFQVVAVAGMPSGKAVRFQKATGNRSMNAWQPAGGIRDVSVVALLQSIAAGTTFMGIVVRGSGGDGTDTGYFCRLINDTSIEIAKLVGGATTTLASASFAHGELENLFLRFDAVNVSGGVLLRAKAWRGELNDEPEAFATSFTETASVLAAGNAGLCTGATNSPDFVCGFFRVRSLFGNTLETLRFTQSASYLPRDIEAIPSLMTAEVSPGAVSLGENLGERATIQATFKDHRHADLGELFERGTFWGKFRARELFRRGQPVRLVRGLLGQALGSMETRHYVLDSFNGPTFDGRFELTGKDPLKLADDDRALAPRPSSGFLVADVLETANTLTLSPGGIGNAEYPASGFVAVGGKEIMAFTRTGDALSVTRAQFGTTAIRHSAEDRVQLCRVYNGQTPASIINDLFVNFADIPPAFIPLANWQTECDEFLDRLYTKVIADPLGVKELVSRLIEQAGLAVWWDSATQQIRLQVLRGVSTDAFRYTPGNVLAGTVSVTEQPDKRITECWTYYGVRNPLEPLDQPDNYRSALTTVDLETETLHGGAVIKTIFADWIPSFGRQTAQRVNDLQIGRFATPPRRISFDVLRYSGVDEPQLGSVYRFDYWGAQDEIGGGVDVPIQVTRLNPMADRFRVEAEEMLFTQRAAADLINRVILFDSNINNVNLKSVHDSIYPALTSQDVLDGVHLTVIVGSGAVIGSTSLSAAFNVGVGWPVGLPIQIQNLGTIAGRGGDGGHGHTQVGPFGGTPGLPGGTAFLTTVAISLDNTGGVIGGGGGGGGGGGFHNFDNDDDGAGGGGGGGAGAPPGSGGLRGIPGAGFNTDGVPGTLLIGGAGGDGQGAGISNDGGKGGDLGVNGANGDGNVRSAPGVAGPAIDGHSHITYINAGTIAGQQIN